ncbi:MAG TPA: efflux RND transporter periplasmic adaptor subunit [Candidatus Baltobacteraceae bacterium]|jgi:cobalt-zinc-cadmium efflux system membrane fusion protein|nr:efflux RND transporter periplasmic adaptor subunit [Candidatus Baltobacteraceae bacterium]
MNVPPKAKIAPAHFPAKLTLPIWVSLLALAGLLGCSKEKPPTFEPPPDPKVDGEKVVFSTNAPQLASIAVETAQIRTTAVAHVTGRLCWDEKTTVGVFTPVAGRVTDIRVDLGQPISVGTPLAEIDSPDFAQALANARTAVGNLAAADKALSRSKDLLAHGAAAVKDVEAAQAAYVAALAERDRAQAVLANYGGTDKSTNAVYILRSPIAGVLVDRNINPGQELRADLMLANAPNLFAPSFVVSDPTRLWLQLDVAESDLSNLHSGQHLDVYSRAFPGKVFDGVVDLIGDTMDPSTRTVKVRGVVNNPDNLLKSEMYVLVDVVEASDQTGKLGVEVPSTALFMKGDDSFVFLEDAPGTFERKQVKVGIEQDDKVPIFEGINPGQKVVTEGALLLQALVEPSS